MRSGDGGEQHGRARAPLGKREPRFWVTDLNMPGMDGYELAQRAAATRPGLQVIMLSGREIDGRGCQSSESRFLEQDLAHTLKQTTGLC